MSYVKLFVTPSPSVTNLLPGKKPVVKILGVPFDNTSTYRSGSRFGPNAVREAFLNIEVYSERLCVDLEALSVEDLGNLYTTSSVQGMLKSLSKVVSELVSDGATPAILGGEHTITYGITRYLPKDTTLLVFDAHLDLRDEYADLRMSHATFLRRIIEKRGADFVLHIGARAASEKEWKFAKEIGLKMIPSQVIFSSHATEEQLRRYLDGSGSVYVSIDMDVLDPAYAPAVANPESAGLSTSQMLEFIYALKGKKILGFDIVEFTPHYDNGSTGVVAAKFLAELSCLISQQNQA